ncbi:2-C-methyl-D-erythritol 4-phosphate cytidylyltransferase [Burkholderiales bacterium GJ-E10]|nr:2-C-methyl-D-erythritol 4-phosphate cytidylyltransferase [Burkholderiales bacterium GJ-E10]
MNQIVGLIPAAGTGVRMRADRPKQYLSLGPRTLLEWSVDALAADARVQGILVVVAPGDTHAQALDLPQHCEVLAAGGATRAETVRNGVHALAEAVPNPERTWVLVHDAARPCLGAGDLAALIDGALDEDGGLLAAPLADTVKREQEGRVAETVDRTGLWRALTPQMFRLDVLRRALDGVAGSVTGGSGPGGAAARGFAAITDESAAVEALGRRPRLIAGSAGNMKVTEQGDLALAEAVLKRQGRW